LNPHAIRTGWAIKEETAGAYKEFIYVSAM